MMIAMVFSAMWTAAAPVQEPTSEVTSRDRTVEDVEIMRRLLVRTIDETKTEDPRENPGAPTVLSYYGGAFGTGRAVSHSRGFHVPGSGAVFTLDLSLPVREVEEKPEEKPDEPRADDEWERARREVLGGGLPSTQSYSVGSSLGKIRQLRARSFEIDPAALDGVVDSVLETVARHGRRIRGLDRSGSITVAMHVRADNTASAGLFSTIVSAAEDDEEAQVAWAAPFAYSVRAAEVRVVVRVPLTAVSDYIDDRIDHRQLRSRAVVYRY